MYFELHDAVVCVRRSSWESVTEREELVGKFSFGSRFPQYLQGSEMFSLERLEAHLITAMLTGAKVLAR